ncbi:MAG: hypothetical protein K9G26_09605 [Emcibacter sp.]|nr:hypothetical protein [Emcibacter sp.]
MISAVSAYVIPTSPQYNISGAKKDVALNDAKSTVAQNTPSSLDLTEEEKTRVAKLKKIDREVKAHEQAHKNAGGKYAGSASFGYEVGPDGVRYAVSGEVSIDIAPVKGDPRATIDKMNAVSSAALAPLEPSGQDRRVAAQAASIRARAQAELAQQTQNKLVGNSEENNSDYNILNKPVLSAYEAGNISENSEKKSGSILDLVS